jgi:hypothetical protein
MQKLPSTAPHFDKKGAMTLFANFITFVQYFFGVMLYCCPKKSRFSNTMAICPGQSDAHNQSFFVNIHIHPLFVLMLLYSIS